MVEDEYHFLIFLLACPACMDLRKIYFKKYYYKWPSLYKFKTLMSSKSITLLRYYLGIYLKRTMQLRPDL